MSLSKRARFRVLERDGFRCQYCGASAPDVQLEVDHKMPRCRGGRDNMENLVASCYACNRGKAGSLVTVTYMLVEGQDGAGPLDGQAVASTEKYPVLWVYRYPDSGQYITFDDAWQADAIENDPYVYRLTQGVPWRRSGAFAPKGGWHSRMPYPDLVGFYVIVENGSREMYFVPPAEMLHTVDLIGEQP